MAGCDANSQTQRLTKLHCASSTRIGWGLMRMLNSGNILGFPFNSPARPEAALLENENHKSRAVKTTTVVMETFNMKRSLLMAFLVFVAGCGQKTTDDWMRQLKDGDVLLRREAIRELGDCREEAGRVVPALTEMLHDKDQYVRHDAALTLGKFGPEARESVPAIKALLNDRRQNVRHGISAALKKITGSDNAPNGKIH